jgi:superfamily II DNA or RNA helicase
VSDDDLLYRPPAAGLDWLTELSPRTCLFVTSSVVGPRGDGPDGAELRVIEGGPWSSVLRRGTYAYQLDGDWHVVAVVDGLDPGEAEGGRYRFTRDGHLVVARSLHEGQWALASHGGPAQAAFGLGDVVRPEGAVGYGRVRQVSPTSQGHRYHIEIDGMLRWYDGTALSAVDGDPADPRFWLAQPPAGAAQLALTLTWTKLRHPLTDTLYSFASSKTLFRAYQFTPVLKLLNGSGGRLLIADEVGLGKTIEAGLIWSELEQRMPVQRALVVAPAPLTYKWRSEMERRFDRRLRILKPADLYAFAERLARDPETELHGIVSLESLRTADAVLERLTELQPRLDLVIVDEAHDLRNRGTRSHTVGTLLADWADYLVLLSATPLNLGSDDLYHLVSLLDEGTFPDRAAFADQLAPNGVLTEVARGLQGTHPPAPRSIRERLLTLSTVDSIAGRPEYPALCALLDTDAPLAPVDVAHARRLLTDLNLLGGVLTRTRKVDVPNDKAVREPRTIDVEWTPAEREFYDTVRAWYLRRAGESGVPPGFATQMPLRQAASCIPAAQEVLRRKDPTLFADETSEEPVTPDLGGLDVAVLTRPITVDTKYDQLLAELLRARTSGLGQMMLFSFFRATLRYLASRLREHFTVRVMDGTVAMDEREQIMRDFRAGKFDILLLSQVGAEGLDFEFCNVLVNYDLPWNPMEVEQRIGRLDRFGQTHEKIFIYNMRVPGTVETDIFQRLYDRIDLFHRSIGELEPILREEMGDVTRALLNPRLSAEDRDAQIERMAVATEQRAQDLARLEQSRGVLAGIDTLLVDGLTEQGLGHGRYVGTTEIGVIVGELLRRTEGSMTRPDDDGRFEVRGSRRLAAALLDSRVRDGGSRHERSRLAAMLRDEEPIPVTLSAHTASVADLDLLSSRHPLVRLSLELLTEESLALRRFGVARVPGLSAGAAYLVTIDLAATTGLRPLLELWATATSMSTLDDHAEAGDALLTALADGTLQPSDSTVDTDALVGAWEVSAARAAARRVAVERSRAEENESLVDGRIRAQLRSLDLKLARAAEVLDANLDPAVRRLHEGRVRALRRRRDEIPAELDRRRDLTLTLTPVAVVLLT